MIVLKVFLLFLAIVSLITILEQLYIIGIALKCKANIKDNGLSRLVLSIVFSVSVALLVVLWDKF
jgi:hypothetical protein